MQEQVVTGFVCRGMMEQKKRKIVKNELMLITSRKQTVEQRKILTKWILRLPMN